MNRKSETHTDVVDSMRCTRSWFSPSLEENPLTVSALTQLWREHGEPRMPPFHYTMPSRLASAQQDSYWLFGVKVLFQLMLQETAAMTHTHSVSHTRPHSVTHTHSKQKVFFSQRIQMSLSEKASESYKRDNSL